MTIVKSELSKRYSFSLYVALQVFLVYTLSKFATFVFPKPHDDKWSLDEAYHFKMAFKIFKKFFHILFFLELLHLFLAFGLFL